MMSSSDADQATKQWLDRLTNVLPPVTLLVSLMIYFAWVRRIAQANALGFDPSLLQEPSVPGYLMRSVPTLYLPIVGASAIALGALLLDRRIENGLRLNPPGHRLRIATRVIPAIGICAPAALGVLLRLGPVASAYAKLYLPFALAFLVLSICYAHRLRSMMRRAAGGSRRRHDRERRSLAVPAVTGLLVAGLLFAGVDGYAQVVGRGLARQFIESSQIHTKAVLLFSKYDLQLAATDAEVSSLATADEDGYKYLYSGLRLAFVDGGSYFLIPPGWPNAKKFIVLDQENLRIEFIV